MERAHIGVDIVVNMMPERIRRITGILVHVGISVFSGFLIYATIPLMKITRRQLSSALQIPMHYIYFSVLLFGLLCILFSAYEIWRVIYREKYR